MDRSHLKRKVNEYDKQETSKTPKIMTGPKENGIRATKKKEDTGTQQEREKTGKKDETIDPKKEITKKEKYIRQKKEHYTKKEEEFGKKKEDFRKKEDDIRKKKEEIAKKNEDIRKKKEEIARKNEDIRKKEDDIRKKNEDIRKNKEDIRKNKDDIRQNKDDIRKKEDNIRKKEDDIRKKEEKLETNCDNRAYYFNILQNDQTRLVQMTKVFDEYTSDLKKNEEDLKKNEEDLKKNEEDLKKDREDLKKDREDLKKDREDLKKDREDLEKDREDLEKDREVLEKDREDLEKDREDLEKDREDLKKAQVHICTFYLIDVNGPARVEQQKTTTAFSYSLEDLEDMRLIPPSIYRRDLFKNTINSGSYDVAGKYDGGWNYVFTWESSIKACEHSHSYYSSVDVLQKDIRLPDEIPEQFEYFDKIDCQMVPCNSVKDICDKFRQTLITNIDNILSVSDTSNALTALTALSNELKEEPMEEEETEWNIYGAPLYQVTSFETQISELFFFHLSTNTNFNHFEVFKEFTISNHFSPFFRSRADFCIFRKGQNPEEHSTGAVVSILTPPPDNGIPPPDDTSADDTSAVNLTFEGLAIEAKMIEKDKMLANMEITAAKIANKKMNSRIDYICIIGALLNYRSNKGTIYRLTLDFKRNKSTVTCSQEISKISTVMMIVLNSI